MLCAASPRIRRCGKQAQKTYVKSREHFVLSFCCDIVHLLGEIGFEKASK